MRARLLTVLLLGAAARAGATMVAPLDLPSLAQQASDVVVGRVESQSARWTQDHSAIFTEVTVRVSQSVKGISKAGDAIVLRREGGEVGGLGMLVTGAARFTVGEEVVLFLEKRGAALWTVGMAQGKLHVAVIDGRKVAIRDVGGLGFVAPPAPEPAVRPLDELIGIVRAELRKVRK